MARSCAEHIPASCDPPQAHAHSGTRAVQKGREYLFTLKLSSWWVAALTFVDEAPWPLLGQDMVSAPRHCKSEGKTHVHRALLPQAGVQRAEGRTWLPEKVALSGPWALVVGDGGEVPGCGRGKCSTWNPSHSECGVLTRGGLGARAGSFLP